MSIPATPSSTTPAAASSPASAQVRDLAEVPDLDLSGDVVTLARALCDIESVSGAEKPLADAVELALRRLPHLRVLRDGNAVVARTELGRPERVVLAGHLDTVPVAANLPCRLEEGTDGPVLHGRGTVDMKAGVAVLLRTVAALDRPNRDLTLVLYDHEEVAAVKNGLGRLVREHREWIEGDFAVLGEPTAGEVEGGCNGTIRVEITLRGVAAHSARSWMGHNAVHDAADVLLRLRDYRPRTVEVDGLAYREGLNAVLIQGGNATNVLPDRCVVTVNYRFAPDRSPEEAEAHLRELFADQELRVVDVAAGARPGLDHPGARAFVEAVGAVPGPKYGWTDVARFGELGIPAVNFGPGDPSLAHRDDERCPVAQILRCEQALARWLG